MSMKKHHYLAFAAFVVLILVAVASIVFARTSTTLAVNSVQIIHQQTLPGQIAPSIKGLTPVRSTASGKLLNLSIGLNLRNAPALDALIAAQNNPKSSSYHHYLTPLQFEQSFAPTQASVQSVTSYLQSQGIQVTSVAPNRMLLNATSSVTNAEHAFNVTIQDFSLHGRSVYSPDTNPSVPTSLNGIISTITGLDNVAYYHYNSQLKQALPHVAPTGGYTPNDLRAAYDINPLLNSGANGTGQTVAIFELDGFQPSDISTYLSNYGLGSAKIHNRPYRWRNQYSRRRCN